MYSPSIEEKEERVVGEDGNGRNGSGDTSLSRYGLATKYSCRGVDGDEEQQL
jgi:hypothetical protein